MKDEGRKIMDRYNEWYENNVVRCSECGKILGFNDMNNCHTYDGEPICDSCAATNGEGFICPECGLKHPYERMGNDGIHCIDCEQRYDY